MQAHMKLRLLSLAFGLAFGLIAISVANSDDRLSDQALDGASGGNPGYRAFNGSDWCSLNSIEGDQKASYQCGPLGATCIVCQYSQTNLDQQSGIQETGGSATLQSNNQSKPCSDTEKFYGQCEHRSATDLTYYCKPSIDSTLKCAPTLSYPVMSDQQ